VTTSTYDVTAISVDDERVPLITTRYESTAFGIAQNRSADGIWQSVEIRESATGQILATYIDGEAAK
jgi:hypothetical protein